MDQWVLEKKSMKSLSNIRGESGVARCIAGRRNFRDLAWRWQRAASCEISFAGALGLRPNPGKISNLSSCARSCHAGRSGRGLRSYEEGGNESDPSVVSANDDQTSPDTNSQRARRLGGKLERAAEALVAPPER